MEKPGQIASTTLSLRFVSFLNIRFYKLPCSALTKEILCSPAQYESVFCDIIATNQIGQFETILSINKTMERRKRLHDFTKKE